jgi:hypothetical protein
VLITLGGYLPYTVQLSHLVASSAVLVAVESSPSRAWRYLKDALLGLSGCRPGIDTGSEPRFSLSSLVNVSRCLASSRAPGVSQQRSSRPPADSPSTQTAPVDNPGQSRNTGRTPRQANKLDVLGGVALLPQ